MSAPLLRVIRLAELPSLTRRAVDDDTFVTAARIVKDVRSQGEPALRHYAERFGELAAGESWYLGRAELEAALGSITADSRALIERTAARIRAFAEAQRDALAPLDLPLPGGRAGHTFAPVERAGGYAPGGRFALPSSVLMTAIPARVAGVAQVYVASPRPTPIVLAAAAVAGADGVLRLGGAHAIATLAYGAGDFAPCDRVVGPGNRWVTAAKKLVAGDVGIDMLAGPSELVVVADNSARATWVAADLLAQAEHDPDARVVLVTADAELLRSVERALAAELLTLPTAATARAALAESFAVLVPDHAAAVQVCNRLAPEHLHLVTRDADALVPRLDHYGALFIGAGAAEVLGDYGAGPNHVLPTGGTARFCGGLSVHTFLRTRTWLRVDDLAAAQGLIRDAAALAEIEGLAGHAISARLRAS